MLHVLGELIDFPVGDLDFIDVEVLYRSRIFCFQKHIRKHKSLQIILNLGFDLLAFLLVENQVVHDLAIVSWVVLSHELAVFRCGILVVTVGAIIFCYVSSNSMINAPKRHTVADSKISIAVSVDIGERRMVLLVLLLIPCPASRVIVRWTTATILCSFFRIIFGKKLIYLWSVMSVFEFLTADVEL